MLPDVLRVYLLIPNSREGLAPLPARDQSAGRRSCPRRAAPSRPTMILAISIINNFGKCRFIKLYREHMVRSLNAPAHQRAPR